jgi:hypothetical protein
MFCRKLVARWGCVSSNLDATLEGLLFSSVDRHVMSPSGIEVSPEHVLIEVTSRDM